MNESSKFYAIFNNRKLHEEISPSNLVVSSSFDLESLKSQKNQTIFTQLFMQPQPSRRFIIKRGDNLNISDIPGTKPSSNINIPKTGRDYIQVDDIQGTSPKSLAHIKTYDKNSELMRESVLGKKKHYIKNSDPLDPSYIMRSPTGRRIV